MSSHPARLGNKVALVTGASSGLGRAISLAYASHGSKLIVCADMTTHARPTPDETAEDVAESTHDAINRLYGQGKAVYVEIDVRKPESVKYAVSEAVSLGGRLDIIVNNAGIGTGPSRGITPLHEELDEDFDLVMDINIRGVYFCTKHALAQMMKQETDANGRRGWVINIASVLGMIGLGRGFGIGSSGYAASKGAVIGFTKNTAVNYAPYGICVNAICPGFVKTALTRRTFEIDEQSISSRQPLGGWLKPTDIAKTAVFLASEDAAAVTGIGLPVDAGYSAG